MNGTANNIIAAEAWVELREWLASQGPFAIAAGDVREIKADFDLTRQQDLAGIDFAVSLACPLPREALAGIKTGPTLLYKHLYQQVNYLLDRTTLLLSLRLQSLGARAIPIPASQLVDWERLRADVNHRQVAVHLGQGWYGRNNLLVTPEHGAQVRLATLLTDAELVAPGPWADRRGESGCSKCRACVAVCPVKAIHEGPRDFDLAACSEKTREFEKIRGIGQRICGVCVRACPGPREAGS